MLPARDDLTICFAHAAYRMQDRFALRNTGIRSIEVRDRAALDAGVGAADVLVVSGLWDDALIPRAPRLRFIQSISAGWTNTAKTRCAAPASAWPAPRAPTRAPCRSTPWR